jgi:cell division septation protein DedD
VAETETQYKKAKRLQLDRTQVGLLLGFVSVGLVLAFGAGFITGLWYQTKEQIRPLDLKPTVNREADDGDDRMTFYSTLTRSDSPAHAAAPAARPLDVKPEPTRQAAQQRQARSVDRNVTPAAPAARPLDVKPEPTRQAAQQSQARSVAQNVTTLPNTAAEQYFSIQVGSFRARDEAERLYTLLSKKGYQTVVKTVLVPGKGILYRVRVGQFTERAAAKQIARRLKSEERLAVLIVTVSP